MRCRNCGAELPTGAMFCGECGATVAVPKLVEPATRARPGDTVRITPVVGREPAAREPIVEVEHVAGPEPVAEPVDVAQADVAPTAPEPIEAESIEAESVAAAQVAAEPVPAEPVVAEPVPADPVAPEPVAPAWPTPARPGSARPASSPLPPVADRPTPAAASAPLPMPPQSPADHHTTTSRSLIPPVLHSNDDHDDVEATRIVRGMKGGDRFVLQFSTGENSIVFGSGLIGRNPVLEPGESVDQLIAIVDSGKSVSKTHLEFGQIEGAFWVSDRFSANGTIVRQPDARPQRLEPGRRQQVARGTRIDIGEQFFVVS